MRAAAGGVWAMNSAERWVVRGSVLALLLAGLALWLGR